MKFDVNRSILIDAPVATVRGYIEDFHHWNSWSPWTVIEPDCTVQVSGNPNEPGHAMSWDGNVIGAGKNTLESTTAQCLNYHLAFYKPWKSTAQVAFIFDDLGDQTRVTWTMNSSMPFFMFFMIKMMKNMIGMDYDRGLAMLKALAETGDLHCKTRNAGIVEYKGFSYRGIQRTVSFADMPAAVKQDFETIVNDIVVKEQKAAMHWVCIYPKFDMKNMQVTYIAAISDENLSGLTLGSDYVKGRTPDGKALEITHDGAYQYLGNAWAMGSMTLRAQRLKGKGDPFEQYWNNPMEHAPEDLKTSVYFPLRK